MNKRYGLSSREMKHIGRSPVEQHINRYSFASVVVRLSIAALLAFALMTLAMRLAESHYTPVHAETTVKYHGKELSLSTFCKQAVVDHESWGREVSPDLKDYCGL